MANPGFLEKSFTPLIVCAGIAGFYYFILLARIIIFQFVKHRNTDLEFVRPNVCLTVVYIIFLLFIAFLGLILSGILPLAVLQFPIVFYIVSIITTFCSAQYKAMSHRTDVEGGMNFCQKMRESGPVVSFHVECYHYTTVTTRDSKGHTHTRREKRVTYSKFFPIPIPYWCDATPPLYVPDFRLLIHIKTRLIIEWMHNSLDTLDKMRNELYDKNKHRDTYCSVTRSETIPGLIPETMILNGKKKKIPFFIRWPRYLFAFLGLGHQVAYHIATVASVERFRVIKKVSLEAPVVTPEFCQQYQLDYSAIAAQAPILNQANYASFNYVESETDGVAATVPCVVNPVPLTITSSSDYNTYYNNMNYYDQIYQNQQNLANQLAQQQQEEMRNDTGNEAMPTYTSTVDNDGASTGVEMSASTATATATSTVPEDKDSDYSV